MEKSVQIAHLITDLIQAQGEIGKIREGSTNDFNGNTYASIGQVIEAIKPTLQRHGLTVIQFPIGEGSTAGVLTILAHTSGEWIAERVLFPIVAEKGKSLAQTAAGCVSYAARYALKLISFTYTEADTDGAPTERQTTRRTESAPAATRPATRPAAAPERPTTGTQGGKARYGDGTEVFASMQEAFDAYVKANGRAPLDFRVLKDWKKSRK